MDSQPEAVEDREPESTRVTVSFELRALVMVVAALILAAALFAVGGAAEDRLIPIGVGLVLALALDPVVGALRRRLGWGRHMAATVVALAAVALTILVILLVGPAALEQAREFERDLPETVQGFYDLPLVGTWLEDNDAEQKVQDFVDELPARVDDRTVEDTVDSLIGGAATALIALAVAFAVLFDGDALVRRVRALIPERSRPRADRVGQVLYRTFGQYFGGSITVAVLMGVYVLVIGLAFGVPLAPIAAMWAMITDLIPQIGGFLGGSFLTLLALSVGVPTAIIVGLLFLVYMNFENHVISPAVVGEAVDLSPPTTMLAALIGGAAAGVPGALVATPTVGATKRLYYEYRYGPPDHAADPAPSLRERVRALLSRGDD